MMTRGDYNTSTVLKGMRGGKNAKKVWYKGIKFESIVSFGRHLTLTSPATARMYINIGYTPMLDICFKYDDESEIKDKIIELSKKVEANVVNSLNRKKKELADHINRTRKYLEVFNA